ncbi:MAG TPA: hypothetical protein VGW58_14455 [Pyrinomonadaceae bacterium]|nr:hypothetical protein [Pyrinomonadaceae bacterium]
MKLLTLLFLSLLLAPSVFADDRATEILKQAREAIGGEQRLQKIEALHINGQYRRVFGERQMGGDREISIALPGKYLVEDSMNPGGLSTALINTRGLNGERAWSASSGGGGMIFRMAGPGGQQLSAEQMEASLRRIYQAEFTRYLLAMTLAPPASLLVEYKYAGESDVEGEQADVIDVTGPDNFSVRLFLAKKNHLPLLLSYRGPKPRVMTFTRPAGGSAKQEDLTKSAEQAAEKQVRAEATATPEEVDFFIRLSDHKKVDGITLPFKLTFLTESEVSEEFEISKYQVNPQFKADKFEKH